MFLLLLAGCPTAPPDTAETADTGTCETATAAMDAELTSIQTCTTWEECGQPLPGTSCGCTNNAVARLDADPTAFYAAQAAALALGCDLGASTCDCPAAYGFDCVDSTCTWDYATGLYLPDCHAERGTNYDVSGIAIVGDELTVSVGYSGGCQPHTFTLCWPEQAFAESDPVQASLELFHETTDDCEAYLTEDVVVPLAPLREAWAAAYGGDGGVIVIHVGGQTATYTF